MNLDQAMFLLGLLADTVAAQREQIDALTAALQEKTPPQHVRP